MNITEESFASFQTSEDLLQFLHQTVNNLTRKPPKNADPDLQQLANSITEFYCKKATDQTTVLPTTVPSHIVSTIESVFRTRQGDIVSHVVKQRVAQSGRSLVENFDWRLKWILGSSKVSGLREPVCQVDLICAQIGDDLEFHKSLVSFECDLNGIDQLISVLTAALSTADLK